MSISRERGPMPVRAAGHVGAIGGPASEEGNRLHKQRATSAGKPDEEKPEASAVATEAGKLEASTVATKAAAMSIFGARKINMDED